MMRVTWTDKVSNEEVLRRAGVIQETIEGHSDEAAKFHRTCDKKRRSGKPGVDWQDRWEKEQGETITAVDSQFSGMRCEELV